MGQEKRTAFPGDYAGARPAPPIPPQEPGTSPWVWALRFIFTLGLVCTTVFIFKNSLQIAEVSSAHSREAMGWINRLLRVAGIGPLEESLVRKLAHFGEFALLGFWFMLCLRVYTRRFVRHVSWPLFFGLLVANIDETIQLYVPGRSSSVRDVLIDFAGVLAGLFVALLILLFVRMCTILWKDRREL